MRIFEFQFNPQKQNKFATGQTKSKESAIFNAFCYIPENAYEKKSGNLFMAGSLKNTLPQSAAFLDNLAKVIKERYYKSGFLPEKSLKDSLKKANEHLEKIAKEGDVSWLGNLSFIVLSLKKADLAKKISLGFELHFTKVGDLKIFLLRQGQIIDIEKEIKFEGIEPYPLKIFGNIVSGKLAENDTILILTQDLLDAFSKTNLLSRIAKTETGKLKGLFDKKKEELLKISGACLVVNLSEETAKEKAIISQKGDFKISSLKEIFSPLLKMLKFRRFALGRPSFFESKIRLPKLKFSKPKIEPPAFYWGKNVFLVLALIFVLIFGFFVFKEKERQKLETLERKVSQIEEKMNKAEAFLIIAKTNPAAKKSANLLLKESWDEISVLAREASSLPEFFVDKIVATKEKISEKLKKTNQLIIISEPELFFEFNQKEFLPQKLAYFGALYCFSPLSENIFLINETKEEKALQINQKISSTARLPNSLLLFAKPDRLINLKEGQFEESVTIPLPDPQADFAYISSYQSNLYFLDHKTGEIIKYSQTTDFVWDAPKNWLIPETKKATEAKSMAADSSLWILTKENTIDRYYAGILKETIKPEIFPAAESFSKLYTSSQLPYLYLLEPGQNRIAVFTKSGQIVKQFQSEKFDNLKDFAVSDDGKTIYLLSGVKIYQILF